MALMAFSKSLLILWINLLFFYVSFERVNASGGDKYPSYRTCIRQCTEDKCIYDEITSYKPSAKESWFVNTLWSCHDNCKYECMWPVVRTCFLHGWKVPQFRGKWPFTRWLGLQEPASAVFSLMNLIIHLVMFKKFYKSVRMYSEMFWIWTVYAIVSTNAWIWSMLFHSRDLPLTEVMDYVSAFAVVSYTFYLFGYRVLLFQRMIVKLLFTIVCTLFFAQHVSYLILDQFDYKYSMDTVIIIGSSAGIIAIIWSTINWGILPHVGYAATFVIWATMTTILEIFDFSPFLWTFDAHALWHLFTIPLHYIIYK